MTKIPQTEAENLTVLLKSSLQKSGYIEKDVKETTKNIALIFQAMEYIKEKVEGIEDQTKKTNGSVADNLEKINENELGQEKVNGSIKGQLKYIFGGLGFAIFILPFIFYYITK